MNIKIVMLVTVCSTTMLSADYYNQSSCPNGNCSYPSQGAGQTYYQGSGQNYYQGSGQNYYQGSNSYNQYPRHAYYDSTPPQQTSGWNGQYQNSQYNNQSGTYNQNPQYNNQGYYNPNSSSNSSTNNDNYNLNNSSSSDQNRTNSNLQTEKNGMGYNQNNSPYLPQNSNDYDNRSGSVSPDLVGYNSKNSSSDTEVISKDKSSSDDSYYSPNKTSSTSVTIEKSETKTVKRISDEDISEDVREALSPGWFSSGYPDVTFDVKNGVVNLRGRVTTSDEKIKLEKDIKQLDGVMQVNNEVSVEKEDKSKKYTADNATKIKKTESHYAKDTAVKDSDRVINSKIRNKLKGWFSNGYETIIINTSNGVVTITGFVEKPEDIQKINKDVRSVDGVKTVNNNAISKKK